MEDVPEGVLASARAAFRRRRVDVALADIWYDSLLDSNAVADGLRRLTFRHADRFVDVTVDTSDGGKTLTVQLTPASPGELVFEGAAEGRRAWLDATGHAEVAGLPCGLTSLVVRCAGSEALATAWVRL